MTMPPAVHPGDAAAPAGPRSVAVVNSSSSLVVCVVVTRRRLQSLRECLRAIAGQSHRPDHVVVVDNGPDLAVRLALEECGLEHTYLPSRTNLGGAGGFALGILTARSLGADWVWLADDDGRPGGDRTLATLLRCAEDKSLDAVAPLVLDLDDPDRLAFPLRRGMAWARTRSDLGTIRFLPGVAQLFNGTLLSARALDTVGVPDPRLFVRGDEVEVHRRMVRSGLRFGTCTLASYRHPSGARDYRPILGGRVPVYVPAERGRAAIAYRNQGYLTSQPGLRWRRWPDEARYAWYYLAQQRDLTGWRGWLEHSSRGRREEFSA